MEQFICECECELDIQCDEETCKRDECEADECVATCENKIDDEEYECCGEGCCDAENELFNKIVYDEFGC